MDAAAASKLAQLDHLSTDDLFALLGTDGGATGFGDDDGLPPAKRGRRIVKGLLPKVSDVLCRDAGFCQLLLEKPMKSSIELAAIAADVLVGCEHLVGLPVFALALLVVREFLENLCEH